MARRRTRGSAVCASRSAARTSRDRPQAPARRARIPRGHRTQARRATVCSTTCSRPTPRRRELLSEVEELRARQNAASKEIGKAPADERPAKIAAAAALKEELKGFEDQLAAVDAELRALALQVPNPADASVPDGGEDDGEVLRVVGDAAAPPPLDHAAFGEAMGFVETEQAVG